MFLGALEGEGTLCFIQKPRTIRVNNPEVYDGMIWFYFLLFQVDAPKIPSELNTDIVFLLVVDGCLHWMQNLLAFTLLKMVTPLTYAVANVTKRIAVITASLLLLKNPVTFTNMGGMLMAIIGKKIW